MDWTGESQSKERDHQAAGGSLGSAAAGVRETRMLQCALILKGSRVVSSRGSVKKSGISEDPRLCLGPVYPCGKPEEEPRQQAQRYR